MRRLLERCGFTFKGWESHNLVDIAGVFALSLIPKATTTIACNQNIATRLFWRSIGVLATLVGFPFAWLESLCGHPSAGVFFAQKTIANGE
jgi:hypothetical protein